MYSLTRKFNNVRKQIILLYNRTHFNCNLVSRLSRLENSTKLNPAQRGGIYLRPPPLIYLNSELSAKGELIWDILFNDFKIGDKNQVHELS